MADENITIDQKQNIENDSQYDLDSIWKEFVREYWSYILLDVVPEMYEAVDIENGAEFLDKEMHEISQQLDGKKKSDSSKWYVDDLLKIRLKNGQEEWVLLHIEVQGRGGEMISRRMFRYSCLIFLKYGRHPAAVAILTAKRPKREGNPGTYHYDMFGTTLEYKYHTLKTYEYKDEDLLSSDNPVHLFIYAVKMAVKYRKSGDKKLEYMLKVARLLKSRGWSEARMRVFFRYLEFLMSNSGREYRDTFIEETTEILEGKKVKLMTFEEKVIARTTEKVTKEVKAAVTAEVTERVTAEVTAKKQAEFTRSLIGLGYMTNEQIADLTKQTPEYVEALRQELAISNVH